MKNHKYTLPRHTILARQGARFGAFFIDLAILILATLLFYFACFSLILKPVLNPLYESITKEQINSGLYVEDDGVSKRITSDKDYTEFINSLEYYYFNYLPNKNIKEGLEGCKEVRDQYDVIWFNSVILEIGEDPSLETDTGLFTYADDGKGSFNKDVIGVPKESSVPEDISTFIQKKYQSAILDDFNEISYIEALGEKYMFYSTLEFVLSILVASNITYVIIPIIFKNGQTLGKKVYHLGLSNSDGYMINNKILPMRLMPFEVCILSLLLMAYMNIYLVMFIYVIIFLVSFALSMASPKKMSLHDLTARSIVVGLKESVIFENEMEEEKYLLKEDNIDIESNTEIVSGEEPEISYEK